MPHADTIVVAVLGPAPLIVRPHIEHRNGCRFHLDRFDVYLDGELILTSRQPWYDGARELLRRGYPGDTLLTMRRAGKDDDRVVPLEIGYLAEWSISDSDRGALKRVRWQPMPEHLKERGQSGRDQEPSPISFRCSKQGLRLLPPRDPGVRRAHRNERR